MTRILIVDDDPVQLRLTSEVARRAGFTPVTAAGGDEALALLRADPGLGAMILDLVMPDRDGMAVMEAMAREGIPVPVIIQTASSSLETIISATRQGAIDFFVKPVVPERLIVSLRNALRIGQLEQAIRSGSARPGSAQNATAILSRAPAMHRPTALLHKAAQSDLPVLVEGEAGTGKDLFARVIHGESDRASKPFVVFDCAGIPPLELEARLFGTPETPGSFDEADAGTLLLREIGELTPQAQARLAAALETGRIVAPGHPGRVTARLVATSSRRLLRLAQQGEFREDLFYRLNILPITLPPLRDRSEDVEPLVLHFSARAAAELGKRPAGISPAALALLAAHAWPGNVHELESAVFRATVLSSGGDLEIADFPQIVAHSGGRTAALALAAVAPLPSDPVHIDAPRPPRQRPPAMEGPKDRFVTETGEVTPLDMLERDLIAFALERHDGHMSKVARALGIGRSTLYRKLREYGLEADERSDAA